jgi:hypothetical protein
MTSTPVQTPPATQALPEGELGMALLHIERGSLLAARRCLEQAVAGGVSTGGNASLYHGAPAVEFVLSRIGQPGRTLRDVREATDRVIAARLGAARRRQLDGGLPQPAEFELVRGLTGLGAVLLTRCEASPVLREVLTYLVSLSWPVPVRGQELPGWWSAVGPDGRPLTGGHGNLGVAHGIAGPLTVLALATRQGIEVNGQLDAIEEFTGWLERYPRGYWITQHQLTAPELPGPVTDRPSWCYGELGIARTRQLAALALGHQARREAAEDAAVEALTDPARLGQVTDASLCHGWAGLLTVTHAIADDSPAPDRFTPRTDELAARLVAGQDQLPRPGFLEGRSGARLALEGADTTGWTRALLVT